MSEWDAWIGREERREDRADPALVRRWLATFDRAAPTDGTLPHGFHWCLCTPDSPTAALDRDGHPSRDESPDSFLPPIPLPRRMWAASSVEFLAPLGAGEAVTRTSRIASITEKQGGSGRLVFVEIEHATVGEAGAAVREIQSLVYLEAAPVGASPVSTPLSNTRFDPAEWDAHRVVEPSEALLFRYSALTFNSHRIHYDYPYATSHEGYRGLVVHGPLTATLLLDLAGHRLGENTLSKFAFRGISPAICGEMLHLVLRSKDGAFELGAFATDGREVTRATASI